MQVTLTVNGNSVSRDVEPRMLLVDFLHLEINDAELGVVTANFASREAGIRSD